MPAVVVSRSLRYDLGDSGARDLATDFQIYKSPGGQFGDPFGRDKAFAWPASALDNELWHVHLEEPSVVSVWNSLWDRGYPQENFTSDKILVYGRLWDVGQTPYLLQAILSPNGHRQMDDKERMLAITAEFEEEKRDYTRRLDDDPWIILAE